MEGVGQYPSFRGAKGERTCRKLTESSLQCGNLDSLHGVFFGFGGSNDEIFHIPTIPPG